MLSCRAAVQSTSTSKHVQFFLKLLQSVDHGMSDVGLQGYATPVWRGFITTTESTRFCDAAARLWRFLLQHRITYLIKNFATV